MTAAWVFFFFFFSKLLLFVQKKTTTTKKTKDSWASLVLFSDISTRRKRRRRDREREREREAAFWSPEIKTLLPAIYWASKNQGCTGILTPVHVDPSPLVCVGASIRRDPPVNKLCSCTGGGGSLQFTERKVEPSPIHNSGPLIKWLSCVLINYLSSQLLSDVRLNCRDIVLDLCRNARHTRRKHTYKYDKQTVSYLRRWEKVAAVL